MSAPVIVSLQQMEKLFGGKMPYADGFAWEEVEYFKLEDGVFQPYENGGLLPGPCIYFSVGLEVDVKINLYSIRTDPPLECFSVVISHNQGIWKEVFGGRDSLNAFLLGVRAISEMLGKRVAIPEIPQPSSAIRLQIIAPEEEDDIPF